MVHDSAMYQNSNKHNLLREELKAARLRANLRQVEVAALLKKPQSYVAKVESGERRIDFVETLELCAVIGLDPHTLVDALKD